MNSEEINKDMVLELFYSTKGNIDKINQAIDAKLKSMRVRKITLFEKYIKSRLDANPKVLKLSKFEINPVEAAYLSQYPRIIEVEFLDLRQNQLGDEGLIALSESSLFQNLKELDLRNNQITRRGLIKFSESGGFQKLERIDLRVNKLGSRWEKKFKETENFPNLRKVRII